MSQNTTKNRSGGVCRGISACLVGSALALAGAGLAGCTETSEDETGVGGLTTYVADIQTLNDDLENVDTQGQAVVTVEGDQVTFSVNVEGVPPAVMHLQHLHGSPEGAELTLPGMDADDNGDGIIDLFEARDRAGRTLIPLHDAPASLQIKTETYPNAGEDGSYTYQQTVSLSELESAIEEQYGISSFNPGDYTVMVHGVPADTDLPDSVQSLEGVPGHVTLPIGVGRLEVEVD